MGRLQALVPLQSPPGWCGVTNWNTKSRSLEGLKTCFSLAACSKPGWGMHTSLHGLQGEGKQTRSTDFMALLFFSSVIKTNNLKSEVLLYNQNFRRCSVQSPDPKSVASSLLKSCAIFRWVSAVARFESDLIYLFIFGRSSEEALAVPLYYKVLFFTFSLDFSNVFESVLTSSCMCSYVGQNLCTIRYSELSTVFWGQKAEQGAKTVDVRGNKTIQEAQYAL